VLARLRQRRYLALIAVGAVLAVACTLAGLWQLDRYAAKRDANADLRRNEALTPAPIETVLTPSRPFDRDQRFRKVTAAGRYDAAGQVLVRRREVDDRLGFLVVTPLRTSGGATLLVVRGFVPAMGAATDTPAVPAPSTGAVTVTGRLFPSERGGIAEGLPAGQVDRIDVPALTARLDAPAYGGYLELISAQPAQAGLATLPGPDLSNPAGGAWEAQHLAYVVQWFLFAALALAAPFVLALLDARQPAPARPTPPARVDMVP
jgi:cytochrome oxidase assembly protein ShyY1